MISGLGPWGQANYANNNIVGIRGSARFPALTVSVIELSAGIVAITWVLLTVAARYPWH